MLGPPFLPTSRRKGGRPSSTPVEYVPFVTAAVAAVFAVELIVRWRRRQQSLHLLWWTAGVICFGVAVLAEALVHRVGWSPLLFRVWYITGALLGGAVLAQGTVYLLMKRRTAHRLALTVSVYAALAALLVVLSPLEAGLTSDTALSGRVMEWGWVRFLTPALNLYAVVFLVGGAVWSSLTFWRGGGARTRPIGNALIALGAIAPALRGTVTRLGLADTIYLTELVGLALIYIGYRIVSGSGLRPEAAART